MTVAPAPDGGRTQVRLQCSLCATVLDSHMMAKHGVTAPNHAPVVDHYCPEHERRWTLWRMEQMQEASS